MARSSFSSVGSTLAGCLEPRPCSRSCDARRCCHSPCHHAAGVSAASLREEYRQLCSPRPDRRSEGMRLGGRGNLPTRGFSSCAHRANARLPGSAPPFSTRRTAMGFDRRRIDQELCWWSARLRQSSENPSPDAFLGPTHEAIVERFTRTIDFGRIAPSSTGFEHMHDAADHAAIIHARFASCIGRKMRHKPRELSIAQPVAVTNHRRTPFGDCESQNHWCINRFYGSGP